VDPNELLHEYSAEFYYV